MAARRAEAFTLAELMVVIAVIILLLAMLVPYFERVFEVARNTTCQNNLEKISQALHASSSAAVGTGSGSLSVVTGSRWHGVARLAASKSDEVFHCMEDHSEKKPYHQLALDTILKDVYVLQFHTTSTTNYDVAFLPDIMAGKPLTDPQMWVIYPAANRYDKQKPSSGEPPIVLPTLTQNDLFIGIDNDAAVKLTFSDTDVTIAPYENTYQRDKSRHWVMKGKGTIVTPLPGGKEPEDADDKILCRLWGWHVTKLDPPYILKMGGSTSYGINKLVQPNRWGPKQFYVMDANDLVVDIYRDGLKTTCDRHFRRAKDGTIEGRVNVATVDGSVSGWTKEDLEREFLKEGGNRWDR